MSYCTWCKGHIQKWALVDKRDFWTTASLQIYQWSVHHQTGARACLAFDILTWTARTGQLDHQCISYWCPDHAKMHWCTIEVGILMVTAMCQSPSMLRMPLGFEYKLPKLPKVKVNYGIKVVILPILMVIIFHRLLCLPITKGKDYNH